MIPLKSIWQFLLFVKNWYNISGEASYHELASICKALPQHYGIKQRITELNRLWNIKPTPHGTIGLQQSLRDRLQVRLAHLLRISKPDATFLQEKVLHFKLSGDGTNIGKRLHIINFTFTLLEGSLARSCRGNHILAVLKEPEKYESLTNGLSDIRTEVKDLETIEQNGIQFKIVHYLGGDLKFLAIATGIAVPAVSTHVFDARYEMTSVMMQTDSGLFQIVEMVLEALKKTRELLSVQSHARSIMFQILHYSPPFPLPML